MVGRVADSSGSVIPGAKVVVVNVDTAFVHVAKQAWAPGQIVNVGFVKGLVVLARVPTPGDGRPDCWALHHGLSDRYYSFQPHLGLTRCDNLTQAMAA